jgi:mono/diheme cytochrome c family protein
VKGYLKYFSLVYVIILIALVGFGINYLNDITDYAREKITGPVLVPKDSVKPPTVDLPVVKGTISAPVDIFKLANPTPELVEKGKTIFQTTCATCHGTEGKGDGIAGATLNPKPRNFTSLDGWKNGSKLTQMYKTLQEGIPSSGMASFSNIPPEDRIALIQYIHETFTKNYPKNTEDELKELDKTYSLIAGVKLPNQIPIKAAMEKVIQDNEAVTKKVKAISSIIEKNTTDTVAILFKSVTNNMTKALTLLASDANWQASENQLYNLIGANPVSNGFRGRAATLSQREISVMYQYLKNLFANYKG